MKDKNPRIEVLDGLRGVAALFIVLYHFLYLWIPANASMKWQWIAKPVSLFWTGVDLFFVLSGFLIGDIVMSHGRAKNFFKVFWIRRICRIIPVYVVFLASFYLVRVFLRIPLHFYGELPAKPLWSYLTMLQNLVMSADGTFGNYILGVTWTLAVEWQFYLIIPCILVRLPEKRTPIFCLIVMLLALAARFVLMVTNALPHLSTFMLFPCRMDSFAAGILAAWVYRRYPEWSRLARPARRWFAATFAVLFAGMVLMFRIQPRFNPITSTAGVFIYTWNALFFLCVVLLALWARHADRFGILSNRALVRLGWISYSFYLFHTLINYVIHYTILGRDCWILSKRDLAATGLSFLVVILVSMGLRECVEKPFILWGKKQEFI